MFRDKLVSDEPFGNFWNLVQEMYPEKEDYFASLMDPTKPYEPKWLVKRYNKQVQTFQIIGKRNVFTIGFDSRRSSKTFQRKRKRS